MDNRWQNVVMHEKLEKRLVAVNRMDTFNEVISEKIEAGTLVELTDSKMKYGARAVHYVPMQLEENSGSESTRY